MKKSLTIALSSLLILSGCDTYAGSSAYLGSNIGAILGSAIGGINDGPRGSDVGTIIGMAGGAVVGAIIGNSADQRAHDEMVEHREAVKQRRMEQQQNEMPESNYSSNDTDNYTSGFDATNSGDDRIYDFSSSDYTGNYSWRKALPIRQASRSAMRASSTTMRTERSSATKSARSSSR